MALHRRADWASEKNDKPHPFLRRKTEPNAYFSFDEHPPSVCPCAALFGGDVLAGFGAGRRAKRGHPKVF